LCVKNYKHGMRCLTMLKRMKWIVTEIMHKRSVSIIIIHL